MESLFLSVVVFRLSYPHINPSSMKINYLLQYFVFVLNGIPYNIHEMNTFTTVLTVINYCKVIEIESIA